MTKYPSLIGWKTGEPPSPAQFQTQSSFKQSITIIEDEQLFLRHKTSQGSRTTVKRQMTTILLKQKNTKHYLVSLFLLQRDYDTLNISLSRNQHCSQLFP